MILFFLFFPRTTHSLEKFDDFGIVIKVAACVPVRFSEHYARSDEGSLSVYVCVSCQAPFRSLYV